MEQKNIPLMILGGTIGFLFIIAIACFITYISTSNYGNATEKNLLALNENRQNIYSQYTQKILEISQVPTMYTEDLSKLTKDAIEGRYGKDGAKALFQMINEKNPSLDPSMYTTIQQEIISGREEFKANQTQLIDASRVYKTNLDYFWRGFWLKLAGYPKINLDEFKPITTTSSENVFKSHKEPAPLKLRN